MLLFYALIISIQAIQANQVNFRFVGIAIDN